MAYKKKEFNNKEDMEMLFLKGTHPNATCGPVYLDKMQEMTIEMDGTDEFEFPGGASTSNKK